MASSDRSITPIVVVTGLIVGVLGLLIGGLGVWLTALGGTPYYLLAGLLMILSGALIASGLRAGLWVYALVLIGTALWSWDEVGLDGWALIPRLVAPAVLGLLIYSPMVAGRLHRIAGAERRHATFRSLSAMAVCVGVIAFVFVSGYATTSARFVQNARPAGWDFAQTGTADAAVPDGDWLFYGRTPAGDRFSPLTQITRDNVARLKHVWSFSTGDMPRPGENSNGHEFSFEATPIKAGNTLYACTPHRDVVALNATTGALRWRYAPGGDMTHNVYQACRGVSYAETPSVGEGAPCRTRIISTASDLPRLFALDAETGALCPGFGENGTVDLRQGMGIVPPGFHFISSPPLVMGGRVMLSGWVYDNQSVGEPSGVIRAFDAVTGRLVWAFDVGRDPPTKPLAPGETFTRGTPNGWGVYTADPVLNLAYIPLGNATPDYWGGERRPFDDAYSSAVVALDITTGEERWRFQTVHHDLWDFDVPVGPSLVDLPGPNGSSVPALIQTTKQGQVFLLDRRTGVPIAPVEERPVAQGDMPGERYAKTQPFSVGMPAIERPKLTETDLWGATPIDQALCRIAFHRSRYDGLFTPPGLTPTIGWPAFDGTSDWYGATIDPERKVMFLNSTYMPFRLQMMPFQEAVDKGLVKPWAGWGTPYPQPAFENNPQHGTPFAIVVKPWLGLFGVPCVAPPWGKMTAIDLTTRSVAWERPLGTTRNMGPAGLRMPFGLPVGVFSMGGSVATRSGLVFLGGTTDQWFRALDGRSGETLWQAQLPAGGNATPLTYLGEDGRQYVVIAAGGHGGLRSRNGDEIIAFALPPGRR